MPPSPKWPVPANATQEALAPINIGWQVLGPATTFCGFAFIIVLARWYTRIFIVRAAGPEDLLISLAMLFMIAHTITAGFHYKHATQIKAKGFSGDSQDEYLTIKLHLAANIIYCIAANVTKASIIFLYLRVFKKRVFKHIRLACMIILLALLASMGWGVFGSIFLCEPVQKLWNFDVPGICLRVVSYWLSFACLNALLDAVVWILPMPIIRKLKLPPNQMKVLGIIFLLGGFTCVVSIIRPAIVGSTAAKDEFGPSGIAALLWASIEANTGIICASLVYLKPLISRICPTLLNDSYPPRNNMHLPSFGNRQNTFMNRKTSNLSATILDSPTESGTAKPRERFSTSSLPELPDLDPAITNPPKICATA